ncbi:hypothetical protein MYX84_08635 [Acidobacteria bacterium AH-259-O06]|nr:hypothetical protein [Acidobacteria bacterium AH-259-O06]
MKNEQLKVLGQLRVECYAGYKGEQRPLRFYLADHRYQVKEVLDQWYEPEDTYFQVRADDGNTYILRHTRKDSDDVWTLESSSAR